MMMTICWQIFTSQWMCPSNFIHPSIHPSVCASNELCHYHYCLRLPFNTVEKGILITNRMNSIDPTTIRIRTHFTKECLFRTERWLIVDGCVRCDVWCVCVFASTYGVKSNLFRRQFYLNVQNCRTEDIEYIYLYTTTSHNVGQKYIRTNQRGFIERIFFFVPSICLCETMSSFFRCK